MGRPSGLDFFYRLGFTFSGNLSQYVYPPLRNATSTRLVELQPGPPGSPISCRLAEIPQLADAPTYEALSYCWGTLENPRDIRLDDRSVPVTANLHSALTGLRLADRSRMLWIDALSINQRDYAERSQQLAIMRNIYQRANEVVAWLGDETESVPLAVDLLDAFRRVRENRGDDEPVGHLDAFLEGEVGWPKFTSPAWSALRYFFRRPWFERAWVIQEAAHAARLQLICGKHVIRWEDIAFAARCIAASPIFASTDVARICHHVDFIDASRRAATTTTVAAKGEVDAGRPGLFQLLQGSQRCHATDPRDKVYGLYPLVPDQSVLPTPDYSKPVGQVYTETAAHIINKTGKLDVLSCAGAARHPTTRHLDLPSWVPDWHAHELSRPIAPLFSSLTTPREFSVASDAHTLSLKGKTIGEIGSLSDPILPAQHTIRRETLASILDYWHGATVTLEPSGEKVHLSTVSWTVSLFADADTVSVPRDMSPPQSSLQARVFAGRSVFRRRGGGLGVVSPYASPGDRIVVFEGASVPYVVRPAGEGRYRLIGECVGSRYFGHRRGEIMRVEDGKEFLLV